MFPRLDVFAPAGIHLPVYGVFLTLLVYGSHVRTAELVRWLPALPGPSVRREVPVRTPGI